MNTTKISFDHERLVAYQRSIQFVAWASQFLENLPTKLAVYNQLDRASTSVPLNIAEVNAKYTARDRCPYFDTARGSALECAACLDVLVAKGKSTATQVQDGKAILYETVSLLVELIRSISPDRLGEEPLPYRTSTEDSEQEQEREWRTKVRILNSTNALPMRRSYRQNVSCRRTTGFIFSCGCGQVPSNPLAQPESFRIV